MKRAKVRFNYDDYLLLPEDKRYEILDGELCMVPAPNVRHQRISQRLEIALSRYLQTRDVGEIFHAPCDVILSHEDIVQPDIFFVRKERADIVGEKNIQGAPDIVIEILSEGTRSKDLAVKRKVYAGFGIPEYWIIDPEADTAEVLVLAETGYATVGIYGKSDRLSSPMLPDLNLPLSEIFP